MGNYEELKAAVSSIIKTNGNQEITGAILQNVLLTIVSTIGANATFAGIATPTTNPGVNDANVFYLAYEYGVYANFDSIKIDNGVNIIYNKSGSWEHELVILDCNKGKIQLYDGTIRQSDGVYLKNETTRVVTSYLIPPIMLNLKAGYQITTVAVYDRITGNI